jgi:phosphoketolase
MTANPLAPDELRRIDAYWRAANYLSVGQIYLLDNPLLREPLRREHVKPRLLGHWGTCPGLNLIYAHLNRVIARDDLSVLYVTGPGHGGPALVANVYLEGTYTEFYPQIARDAEGMKRLFKQFSFPGGIPSHVAPETPGSIHEGGELGYALSHAYGAAFDNPELIVACVVGDGEAETGPLATSWHSNKFLNPKADGAVLPILHLNGYKIANPCFLARVPHADLEALFRGYGYPWLIHRLAYRRTNHRNLHVRGYKEEGTTTTPFDMCVLNQIDRFHLVKDVIVRTPGLAARAGHLAGRMDELLAEHRRYIEAHGTDMPEVNNWTWGTGAKATRGDTAADNA